MLLTSCLVRRIVYGDEDLRFTNDDSRYIPVLNAWKKVDYKKVQKRINEVIRELEKHMNFD